MEPFALFNFLQSLLTAPSPEKKEENIPEMPKNEGEKTEQSPPAQEQNTTFLQFMQAHDERAKRTKKP